MKKIVLFLFFLNLFCFFSYLTAAGEDSYSYGLYLYKNGNYSGAVLELERYLFYHGEDKFAPYLQLLIALSQAHNKRLDSALSSLSNIISVYEGRAEFDDLVCESAFHRLNILFRQKRFIDFYARRELVYSMCPALEEELARYIGLMSVAGFIYNLEWEKALNTLGAPQFNDDEIKASLESEILTVLNHREKSPLFGGFLALLPGFGHFYAGRFPDGFRSLLINAAFASLTVFSFVEERYVFGGIFGTIELFLYASNIYGAVNAVHQENARYIIQRRDTMLGTIPVPPLDLITLRRELNF
jgi:hypothetical protein